MDLHEHDIQPNNQMDENRLNLIQFRNGEIVWAANLGHRFWPAIIYHSIDKHLIDDSKINVQFLYDNGRSAVINVKNSILPFNGLNQFLTDCRLKLNSDAGRRKIPKHIKTKYRTTLCRSWNLAIHEANVLKCVEISKRISIYDSILLGFVKSSISSINKRIKAKVIHKMETDESDESIESGYSSVAMASVSTLTTRHLLVDVLTEQFNKNVKISKYLDSVGRTVPMMEPIDFDNIDDENLTSLKELADQMRKQAEVENGLLKSLCGLFKEMCNIEPAPIKRKRAESVTSSIEDDNESVRTVMKTITEPNQDSNEPQLKKTKSKIEIKQDADTILEERHKEYLACDVKDDEKYIFKKVSKSPVCQYCLKPNDLVKCTGKCVGVYHLNCLQLIPTATHYKSILMGKPLISKQQPIVANESNNKCARCTTESQSSSVCFFCKKDLFNDGAIEFCEDDDCSSAFHEKCHKAMVRQTIKQEKQLCPAHNCQTCKSQTDAQLMKCLLCSVKYHQSSACIPAGCQLLSDYQMICDEHSDAQNESNNNVKPLFGDFVWAKLGTFPWWPALVVPPPRIPENAFKSRKEPQQICVLFFGEHTYGWIWPRHIRLYDDFDMKKCPKNRVDLQVAIHVAEEARQKRMLMNGIEMPEQQQEPKLKQRFDVKPVTYRQQKPKPYKQINANIIRTTKYQKISTEIEICQCTEKDPCSNINTCWNYLSFFECEPDHCPAKDMCRNQNFRNGNRFKTLVKPTKDCGNGLFAMEEIPANAFIIEYKGEIVDKPECDRRFKIIEQANENFYLMEMYNKVYIDAGQCGNEARFINHSCDPNAETQKWIVQGQYRIGIYAIRNIMPGEEISFQYKWDGKTTTICRCGALKCRGNI